MPSERQVSGLEAESPILSFFRLRQGSARFFADHANRIPDDGTLVFFHFMCKAVVSDDSLPVVIHTPLPMPPLRFHIDEIGRQKIVKRQADLVIGITAERILPPETRFHFRPGRLAPNRKLRDFFFRLITQELMFPVAEIAGTRTQQQCRPYSRFHTHLPLKPNIIQPSRPIKFIF